MSELQDLVLDAHGVTRWKSARTIEGYLSITGMLWARKADGIVGFSGSAAGIEDVKGEAKKTICQ